MENAAYPIYVPLVFTKMLDFENLFQHSEILTYQIYLTYYVSLVIPLFPIYFKKLSESSGIQRAYQSNLKSILPCYLVKN